MLDRSIPETVEIPTGIAPNQQLMLPLLYFEIFSYPLTATEIHQYSAKNELSPSQIKQHLNHYVQLGYLFKIEEYYLTHNNKEWVEKRKENNHRAKRYLKRAYWVARLIRRFPFVRAVFLSGALSKHVMPKDGDIDYFIVTKPGRLWVSRTLLILFKKLFLFNSHKYFCVNYFVAEDKLEIEAKNRFTATEIITLIPLYNPRVYVQFLNANKWVNDYYPNFMQRDSQRSLRDRASYIQRVTEWLLNGKTGDRLDVYFLKKTLDFWQRKFANFDPAKFTNTLKSRRDVSKHHPQDFQTKVMTALAQNIEAYTQRYGLDKKKWLNEE